MRLEHYPPKKLKREIVAIVSRHLDLKHYRVFLFGSRVSGKATERSDVDVGIEGPEPIPPATMTMIKEEVAAIPTLYKIDIVDFANVPPGFRKIASQHREMLTT